MLPANDSIKRIFCIGMNYVAHIRELGNEIPDTPAVFMKSPLSLVRPGDTIEVFSERIGSFSWKIVE
jgi:2-keto-4-pentenoate hydratase/2-oxohepta-3-ene-1,7-dioic acid hydratase in catechol pathway